MKQRSRNNTNGNEKLKGRRNKQDPRMTIMK